MSYIPITELDYDNIYAAVSQLVAENTHNIKPLLDTIKQTLDITVPTITNKSWYTNESESRSKILALTDIWTETNKNVVRTAEILFEAWYTALIIMTFHGICATKIKKYIEDANLNETWDIELSYASFKEKTFIPYVLKYPDKALNVGYFNPEDTLDQIDVTLHAPSVFRNSTLDDVLQGNIPVDLALWRDSTMYCDINQVPLNSIGKIIKEHFLVRLQEIIRRKSEH